MYFEKLDRKRKILPVCFIMGMLIGDTMVDNFEKKKNREKKRKRKMFGKDESEV